MMDFNLNKLCFFRISALLSFILLVAPTSTFSQNTCESALDISAGLYVIDSIGASVAANPVCASGGGGATGSKWYTYTADSEFALVITTDILGNAGTDTRVHVYTGECDNLECIGGDDDSGSGYYSYLILNVEPGVEYKIAFDNRWTNNGFSFQLIENEIGFIPFGFTSSSIETVSNALGAVDMNGDFLDDIVSAVYTNIRISYQQEDGTFATVDIPNDSVMFIPTWSIAAGDLDGNGYNDLQYGNGQGVTYMYANESGTSYSETSFSQYVFSQRGNFVDINNDGHLDAFMCHDVAPNVYYLNDGAGGLNYYQGGLGDTPNGGNYGSVWIDYDGDCDVDLFIAKCRGAGNPASINQMHRNNGDGTFTEVGAAIGLADSVQTWSSAWADFDNDGDLDLFVGASSFTAGGHKLMQNNGDGTFSNISADSGFENLNSTSIEWIAHDFDNDGFVDIMGAGNVVMFNNGDLTFSPTGVGVSNGAVADMNNDGFLDIVRPSAIYYNNGNNNNYLKINTIGTVSNLNGIGARVELTSSLGTQLRMVKSGDGFKYMSSLNTHFGIGSDESITQVTVCWPSGIVTEILNPEINSTLTIIEDETTVGIENTSIQNVLSIYPNPTSNVLYFEGVEGLENTSIQVFELSGKQCYQGIIKNNQIDLSSISSGFYILKAELEKDSFQLKFVKQ